MNRLRIAALGSVVVGALGFSALSAPARGQETSPGAAPKAPAAPAAAAGDGESIEAINAAYERQILELDRRRIEQVAALAARQEPAAASATYEHLFRLAIAGNLFREAEPAATTVVKDGSPSPTVVALAYLVKILAETDRGAYDASLATLRQALDRAAQPGAQRSALLTSELVSLCDAYYQRLVQADQFDIAKQAFRLTLERAQTPAMKTFLSGRLKRLELVGKPAPAIVGTDLDGKPFDLAAQKGNVVLVVFWASWCLPSGDDVEWLKETVSAYKARGIKVVGINVDALHHGGEPPAKVLPEVRRFLLDHNVVWPTLMNGPGAADYAGAYGVSDIPASVIIARDGTVAHIDMVRDRLDAALAREADRK